MFSARGRSAIAPAQLALVTIRQFAEGLSDVQAADAVRARIDWKYLLSLALDDPGFDASVLCEFRAWLLAGEQEKLLLDTLLALCREHGLLKTRGCQRTDSTHVLAAVRALNRLELVGEAMRHALNSLAVAAPAWLRAQAPPDWADRYARRAEDDRLPAKQAARDALALTIGADGYALLTAIGADDAPAWLRELPAVDTLRRIWVQNYARDETAIRWRATEDVPPSARFISSPYDRDARFARKRTTQWVGYKVHVTETCDDDTPPLITHIETISGGAGADGEATPVIHAALQARGLLPAVHLVGTGFLDAALLVSSRADFQVDLVGPTRGDYHWQAREGTGFATADFRIDWDRQQATCPQGHTSISWTPAIDKRTNHVVKIKFSGRDCQPCPCREFCTRSRKYPRRAITVRARDEYHALRDARQREETRDFATAYARRAGIEGTLSRGVRTCRLRRTRYVGQAKTHLGHVLTAAGLNFLRLGEWFSDRPRARTRRSPFAKLMTEVLTA